MTQDLGQWALIDIETTGVDPTYDEIIDVGFYQFEGLELKRQYSSLVKPKTAKLSGFIEKLTGITEKQLSQAPSWKKVQLEVAELEEHHLLAHNANFEHSFLKKILDQKELYTDSLPFLALLSPGRSSMSLESFIQNFNLAEKEEHRGLADSRDLLKVLLMAVGLTYKRPDAETYRLLVGQLFEQQGLQDDWYLKFFKLSWAELCRLGEQLDFSLEDYLTRYLDSLQAESEGDSLQPLDLTFSGGNLSKTWKEVVPEKLKGHEYRSSQESFSLKVGQSFKNSLHAMIQAPTGTGKTLGYLLPASLFALQENQPVLVATGTKTLQKQLMTKEVEQLRTLLGKSQEEFKVALLMGSSNHLCELLFRQKQQEEASQPSVLREEQYAQVYFELVFYENQVQAKKLSRGDIPYALKRNYAEIDQLEKELAVDFRACSGQACPYKNSCGYITGLREAREAQVIVGNHALMFSWPRGLERPVHIIVDEAHRLEKEATQALSLELTQDFLEKLTTNLFHLQGVGSLFYLLAQDESQTDAARTELIQKIRGAVQELAERMKEQLPLIGEQVEQYFRQASRFNANYWNELPMVSLQKNQDTLGVALVNNIHQFGLLLGELFELLRPYSEKWTVKDFDEENSVVAYSRFEAFWGHVTDAYQGTLKVLEQEEGMVAVMKFHEKMGYLFALYPIDIGKNVHEELLEKSASVVFSSATLGNATGEAGTQAMEWSLGYKLLAPEQRFKQGFYLPPLYDYENKAKVFLCSDTKEMYHPEFVAETCRKLFQLIWELEGRCLFLFSSRVRFEQAREVLFKEFNPDIPLFVQNMGHQVVEDFKKSPRGILLGMETFGEGIDIPGDALQFVFIDKVPDLRQDLVTQERRKFYERHFGNEFQDYFLAHRARSLQQKLGRLLRTQKDRGAAIIVDARLRRWKDRTMGQFQQLMEPYKLERVDLSEASKQAAIFLKI